MKYFKPTIWLLLVYWIPLMNLGPSLHHADVFGFHSSSCSSCCCGNHHHHGEGHDHHHHSDTCCHDHSHEPVSSVTDASSDGCQFCEFFEKYNVVFSCFHFSDSASPSGCDVTLPSVFLSQDVIAATARGPPVSILA